MHALCVLLKLFPSRIRDLEEKMRIPVKFKFPHYESVNWYASQKLLDYLKSFSSGGDRTCPSFLISGARQLAKTLKNWTEPPPASVKSSKILRDLNKAVRQLEARAKPDVLRLKVLVPVPAQPEPEPEPPKPIKLTIPKEVVLQRNLNLTDRESVRQLLIQQKKRSLAELNDELGSALMGFGGDDRDEENGLKIDFVTSSKASSKRTKKERPAKPNYFIPTMTEAYQDDDYVYPSLDFSDDEEDVKLFEGRKDKDSNWNPKARVKTVAEKRERIPRDKAKRIEVEKGLQLASRRIRGNKKRVKEKKKLKKVAALGLVMPNSRQDLAPVAPDKLVAPTAASSSSSATVPAAGTKPKKGLATAKQRLGKKLKLKFS
jgi:hypothetical protein